MRSLKAASLVLVASLACLAAAEVPRPIPGTFVHDFAGVLGTDAEAEIQSKARRLRDEYKTEIAVVTVNSLEGEAIFDYSMSMARSWGIGSKDNDVRGLLLLVAVRDRQTAFRTSRHIEGELPDGVTGEISREMNSHFKRRDFGRGLSVGMDRILERLKEVYEPQQQAVAAPSAIAAPGSGVSWLWLPVAAVPALGVGYAVLRRRARRRREAAASAVRLSPSRGFRAWASRIDPSRKAVPPPKPKAKREGEGRQKPAARKKRSGATTAYHAPRYESDSSGYSSSSSSSYDSGSSSHGSDSGSDYSGGSDFGGGGSDSSW